MHWSIAYCWIALFSTAALAADAEQGRALFEARCRFCHGADGVGGRAPDLVSREISDAEFRRVVREGIPGSTMPSFPGLRQHELDNLVAFVRDLRGSRVAPLSAAGDASRGKVVYESLGCGGCHRIGTEGSTYGPDLTRIGDLRTLQHLKEAIVEPDAEIAPQFTGVTVTTRAGRRITGIQVGEDEFTIQLRLPSTQLRSFVKAEIREATPNIRSLMPAFKQIPAGELRDLVAYLASLRASTGAEVPSSPSGSEP